MAASPVSRGGPCKYDPFLDISRTWNFEPAARDCWIILTLYSAPLPFGGICAAPGQRAAGGEPTNAR
eukprot:3767589-Pyramimonas_sp.AAC.1